MAQIKLAEFDQPWQAELVISELKNLNIETSFDTKTREYTSIVLGGLSQKCTLYVDEGNFPQAKAAYDQIISSHSKSNEGEPITRNYFKRVVIFSILGLIVLPIVFNIAATFNIPRLLSSPTTTGKKMFAVVVWLSCWAVSLIEIFYILLPLGMR